ncbi:ABC transporter ATP-binding protein [Solwaraspora sp. WMMD406]|uniref:ABC transporter ATP-binding protein n=1 Tax=Solwaraspora sp. WMMD406 TaxID=3016095 RepID=UPI0024164FD5|nr:ABC transporter ATP-binding protein [Solwaraspora sp. WMMD406]MDG4767808.1 ABC transporter ATP-binding protein [Solwaraspora sp. WMMD406]
MTASRERRADHGHPDHGPRHATRQPSQQPQQPQQADPPAWTPAQPPDWRGIADAAADDPLGGPDAVAPAAGRLRARSRALLGSLTRPHRRTIAVAVVLLLVQNAAAMAGPYLVMLGIDRAIPPLRDEGDPGLLIAIGVAFAVTTVAEYVGKRSFLVLSARIGQSILLDLRQRVYRHFLRLSVGFHERYTSGRVVARLTSDMDSIADLVDGGIDDLVLAGLSVISVAGILLWLDPPLAVVTLLAFPFLLWMSVWFARSSTVAYRHTREAVSLLIVHFVESLGGVRAVHAFRREPRNQEIFAEVNGGFQQANLRAFRLIAIYSPGLKGIGNVAIAVVLTFGGWQVLQGDTEIGVLAAFLLYLRRFFEPMQELSQFYNSLQSATAALEKLSGVLDERPEVPDPADPRPLPVPVRGSVELRAVSFGYRPDRVVLPELTLRIPAGQTVALVGATGAGKSTIAKLVARLYDPVSGSVTLDGVDLRDVRDADLRRHVIMVTQENHLFAGSVAENIRFGRPDASDAEVQAAARAIGAHDFIAGLPDGYATDVHRRGGRLSAGQRQLVAFARAVLADPAVLILDEATSSLDVPTERLVQRALHTMLRGPAAGSGRGRTALVIAHRLSTVQIADRVLVLDGGRVVEDGTPDELIAGGGHYAALHQQWRDSLS